MFVIVVSELMYKCLMITLFRFESAFPRNIRNISKYYEVLLLLLLRLIAPTVEMPSSLNFLWFEDQMTLISKMDKNLVPKYLLPV